MISKDDFLRILDLLGDQGREDVEWANGCKMPDSPEDFALEVIYVICNSGMKHKVAVGIFERCKSAVLEGQPVINYFGHQGKAAAIEVIWRDRARLYAEYAAAPDKVAYAETLPWIGKITAYHVAKNFGAQVAKPDVHLQRLANLERVTAQQLCERLAAETGYRVPAVDTVLWRACAYGLLDSRTGQLKVPA